MLDSIRIQTFARELLELAATAPCAWAVLELADDQLVTTLRVTIDGYTHTVDENQVPVAARLAASHSRAQQTLHWAVVEQDPRLLTAGDALDVVQYALTRTIERAA